MAWLTVTLDEFTEHQHRHGDDPAKTWSGLSPGGACGKLGLTRPAIHQAVERGTLEGIRVERDGGQLAMLFIPERAIDQYREKHLRWAGLKGKPIPWLQKRA